jgi:hypothetical protein
MSRKPVTKTGLRYLPKRGGVVTPELVELLVDDDFHAVQSDALKAMATD